MSLPSSKRRSTPADKVRLVCISDTHGRERHLNVHDLAKGDILIHAGDITMHGTLKEIRNFNAWLGQLPHPYKVVIAGNHDEMLHVDPEMYPNSQDPQSLLTNAIYLQDQQLTLYGLKICGSPWIPVFNSPAFSLPRGKELRARWQAIPSDTDILVTHGPPWGYGDLTHKGYNVGCGDLRREVIKRIKPKVHIFGHIHEGYGVTSENGIVYINASICNSSYEPVNPPIVFDVDLPPGHTVAHRLPSW